jgi:phosphoribosylformylglycinamidine synthase
MVSKHIAKMYDACEALIDSLNTFGAGIDGGKDTLSMAAQCGSTR